MNEHDESQAADRSDTRPHPLTQQNYRSVIDQHIAQAAEKGQFSNLPGQGKPIRLDDDSHVDDDDRLGYRMLKGSGFSLPWVEARKDIDEERRRIDAWLVHANQRWPHLNSEARAKTTEEFRKKLEGLRSQILTYNLRVPSGVEQMRGLIIGDELKRLGVE
jgi:hypothetical protein